ncbi:MAG: magnesium transporter CorA [Chloroflexi bacterium]|nr:magnesium transporter CorA [Chloroflexota bacterium]
MAEIKITDTPATERAVSATEIVEKRWFCAAVSPSGTIFKGAAESPAAFLDTLRNATISWIDYVCQDFDKEAPGVAAQLGFSSQLTGSFADLHTTYQDFDTELGIKLPSVQVRGLEVEAYPLLLLLSQNFILTIHPRSVDRRFTKLRRYSETVLKKIPVEASAGDRLTLLLIRLVDENNDRNFEHLREIDERGDELNETMTDLNVPREKLATEIYRMKHALIVYLNALWDTVHVLHTLRYGDAELISDDPHLLNKITILADDVNRQIGLAEHMSEVLASGLEVLQSIYNNQLQNLNNRLALLMTYLTIIGTAVLVPNTLATILGNAVFDIGPHDIGWYLALMVGSTVAATASVYWWVRRRGWLPRKMD